MVASARFELANATVKVWCLTAWLRGNKSGGERWIRTIEPEGTDLQSAAFSHFATSPSIILISRFIIFNFGCLGWIRTSECRIQSAMPYHLATRQYKMVPEIGLEPTTY